MLFELCERDMSRYFLLFILFIGFYSSCLAQEKDDADKSSRKKKDKAYVEKVDALFSLRPFVQQNIDILSFNYKNSTSPAVLYRPATGLNVGGEIAFKFIHFSYQRNLSLFQPDIPTGFEAKHQRIGINIGGNIFGFGFDYQQNNGFFVWNSTVIPDTFYFEKSAVVYREDMQSRTIGTNFRFTFSNKLSANALFDQSQRQLKSKSAFCLILGNRFHGFRSVSPFIPAHLYSDYGKTADMNRIWINSTHFMPGYGGIAVAGYWNVGMFLYSGTGLQVRKNFSLTEEGLGVRVPFMSKLKGGISYNGKVVYSKLFLMADYITTGFSDSNIRWFQSSWELSLGIRLGGKKNK